MIYDACYNCGQQGHFASSCPHGINLNPQPASTRHPPQWKPPPRRPFEEQARINKDGAALCRKLLAERHTYRYVLTSTNASRTKPR